MTFRSMGMAMRAAFCVLLFVAPVHAAEQHALRVVVDGKTVLALDRNALAAMPRTTVDTGPIPHVPAARWQGVALRELLHRAGVISDQPLRGRALATVVRITAADRYQVAFSLGELDPTLGHEQVLVADTQDGHPLTKDGPFRLIVTGDQRPARWVRNVTSIEAASSAAASP